VASAQAATVAASAPQAVPPPTARVPAEATISEPQSPPAVRLDADTIAVLLSRANRLLQSGDFSSARLLLRRAAEAGSASAALMLAATFDPGVSHEVGPIGIQPDIAQARFWYEKAAELGSEDAVARLAKLQQ
jgi:TPR repeat protein